MRFPFIFLMIAVVAVLGANLCSLIVVMGIGSWVVYARVLRGQVLAIKEREHVLAARVIGDGEIRLLLLHILPGTVTPLIVIARFGVARIIVLEAALSFLGLGVEPSAVGLDALGRPHLPAGRLWLATIPGLAIVFTVLGVTWLVTGFATSSIRERR